MGLIPFAVLWGGWLLYWGAAALTVKRRERVEDARARLSHTVPLAVGAVVAGWPLAPGSMMATRFVPSGVATYSLGLAMTALGLGLTVWARTHLGKNWSASIAQNQGHELVRRGPYAWVRHPIYSGLLLAFMGAVVTRGDLGVALGAALMVFALIRKQRLEERWLREMFGAEYVSYCAEVPALVPRLGSASSVG